ncbi:hypothetical protein [Mesorhizobium hungaricum]|mgnify:CR=1 FL=1|jgi:hypothetical protein|uniref:hypothetical protein n=1 Tax=Mesorhizobium TaxID=68287 RepID=UPI00167C6DA2|nr:MULTISPECIES: hypothetical protein [Mesorhizobium]MBN9236048.1 hypothetical protein [Mesorhizobium sp.]
MMHTLVAALAFAPAIILCGGAVYLAAHGLSGWGWFLLVASFIGGSYSYNQKGKS